MKNWISTKTCDRIKDISQDTLVVVGTQDKIIPPKNSILLTQKIHGVWLVQFKEGGHALMFQYPESLSSIVNTFLKN
jgi:pimeloyl-ACP methyl ester carboxylesterase